MVLGETDPVQPEIERPTYQVCRLKVVVMGILAVTVQVQNHTWSAIRYRSGVSVREKGFDGSVSNQGRRVASLLAERCARSYYV